MNETKIFTPQEANKTLPLVRKIVSDILALGQKIRERAAQIGKGAEKNPEVMALADQLEGLLTELEEIGCYYKDWNFATGLVDFPAMIDGHEAWLCWRSDEDTVRYYHDPEAGFAGRRLIPEKFL